MSRDDPLIGRVFGGSIRIDRLLGQGGMGAVYEGYQEKLDRRLAVKVMTPEHAQNPMAADYFLREARSASRLRHPNIIQIIDYGQEDDVTYIAMEYVPGRPLSDVIDEEFPLGAERVVNILTQTLDALDEAHANQIIHRDLKPDNLMIEETREGDDFVKVLDFGIAKPTDSKEQAGPLTQQGAVVGTPQFMSPEQARGKDLDPRSDLFSVGILLYAMLTNALPFEGENVADILVALIKEDPPAPSARQPELEIPPALEAVCLRAMQKDPSLRYETALEFRDALRDAISDAPKKAASDEAPRQFIFKKRDPTSGKVRSQLTDQSTAAMEPEDVPATVVTRGNAVQQKQIDEPAPKEDGISNLAGTYGIDLGDLEDDLLGESRHVVVLVAHQRTHRRLDSQVLRELRDATSNVFERVAEKWDATYQGRRGNQSTMIFGLSEMRSDDPIRAVEAAVELRNLLRNRVHQGLSFGFALAQGNVQAPSDDPRATSGPAIERATDVAVIVDDDVIGVGGADLRDRLDERFELGEVSGAEYATIVGFRDETHRKQVDEGVGLAGRDAEMARILEVLGGVGRGNGRAVIFTGEAGIGKTALLRRMTDLGDQRGYLLLRGRALRSGAGGLRDLHRHWIDELLRHLGRPAAQLVDVLQEIGLARQYRALLSAFYHDALGELHGGGIAATGDYSERDVHAAFRHLVVVLSHEQPVIVAVDGLNAETTELRDFFEQWARFTGENSILFAAGLRTVAGTSTDLPATIEEIALDPLTSEAARAQLRAVVGDKLPMQMEDRLLVISGGVPLYIEALGRNARERKTFTLEEASAWLEDVSSVTDALRQRLFAQPRAVRNVLAMLSVLGNDTSAQTLYELASSKWKPEEAIQKLYDDALIRVEEEGDEVKLVFEPPAFGDVVYDELSSKNRRRIHGKAAEHFNEKLKKGIDEPRREYRFRDALAHHLAECGREEQALSVLETLSDDLLRGFENETAIEMMDRWLEVADRVETLPGSRRARVQLRRARTLVSLKEASEAVSVFQRLSQDASLPESIRVEADLELAEAWLDSEDTSRVSKLCREGVKRVRDLLRSTDVGEWLLVHALKLQARAYEKLGKLPLAAESLFEAIKLVDEGADLRDSPFGARLRWEPVNRLGRIRLKQGETTEAERLFEMVISIASDARDIDGEIAARANLSTLYTGEERLEEAHQRLTEAITLARGAGDVRSVARLLHNRGILLLQQFRRDEAREAFEESRELAHVLDWREGIALNTNQLRRLD